MFKEIDSDTVPLTRDLADEFATMQRWSGERPLNLRRVRALRKELEEGRFRSPEWAVGYLNGVKYRVNGQHSSVMLSEANGEFPASLKVKLSEYHCDTEQDLADLFQTFDQRFSARGKDDHVGAVMASIPEIADSEIPRKTVSRIASAITAHIRGIGAKTSPRESAGNLVEDPRFVLVAERLFRSGNKLYSLGVGAAMYGTWERLHQKRGSARPEHVEKHDKYWFSFWDSVFEESNPDPSAPSRVLARYLRELRRGESRTSDVRKIYVKCIHAWNAHRANKTTRLSYMERAGIPEIR